MPGRRSPGRSTSGKAATSSSRTTAMSASTRPSRAISSNGYPSATPPELAHRIGDLPRPRPRAPPHAGRERPLLVADRRELDALAILAALQQAIVELGEHREPVDDEEADQREQERDRQPRQAGGEAILLLVALARRHHRLPFPGHQAIGAIWRGSNSNQIFSPTSKICTGGGAIFMRSPLAACAAR